MIRSSPCHLCEVPPAPRTDRVGWVSSCRGLGGRSSGRGEGQLGLVVGGAAVAQRRVAASRVVEAVDEGEDRVRQALAGRPGRAASTTGSAADSDVRVMPNVGRLPGCPGKVRLAVGWGVSLPRRQSGPSAGSERAWRIVGVGGSLSFGTSGTPSRTAQGREVGIGGVAGLGPTFSISLQARDRSD
jgi:hypothetical protein